MIASIIGLTVTMFLAGAAEAPPRIARPVDHRPLGVDHRVDDLAFTTLDGATVRLSDFADASAVVIAARDANCPLSKKYGPRLAAIETDYRDRGVRVIHLNVAPTNTPEDMREDLRTTGFAGTYAADHGAGAAARLGVRTTTEVFVLDRSRTLVYRGAVDDQHGIGVSKPAPTHDYLRDALDATLAAHPVDVKATGAPGCAIETAPVAPAARPVTYHDQVSRIVRANCQACHRDGGVAPFALETYDQVAGRARMIDYAVGEGIMPPWFAAPNEHVSWQNDLSLSESDRATIRAWVAADRPEGDPADAPVAFDWTPGWQIGTPDAIVEIPDAIHVPAEGVMDYQYVYVRTDLPEDRWIRRMDVRTDHPEVVHHVLVFIEEPRRPDESRNDFRRRWNGGVRGYFAGLVPGQTWTVYPDGMGKKLPAGAWLKFQIHYTPNGTAVDDLVRIGFDFADEPPATEVRTSSAAETEFIIPPHEKNHAVTADVRFRSAATIVSFAPHMHLRGSAFRYDLILPDGTTTTVLDIPRFDFNWQLRYKLREPLDVPAGAILRATGWFDNSADNPANPNPDRAVPFGEQTSDEMMIGYFEWYRAGE